MRIHTKVLWRICTCVRYLTAYRAYHPGLMHAETPRTDVLCLTDTFITRNARTENIGTGA